MKAQSTSSSAASRAVWFAGVFISLALLLAYSNSFSGPFLYDDPQSITDNPTIRHLWPPWEALSPPRTGGLTVSGRPLLNFSFAVNYALSSTRVWSYHAANLMIHIFGALLLFGIVRRTMGRNSKFQVPSSNLGKTRNHKPETRNEKQLTWLAAAVGLIWALHPLQTESVTYVVQRAESLVGLFYLLTLYSFVRGVESVKTRGWLVLSVFACLCGMATKEVMVSAPLIVLLYDRTFVAGTFRDAWKQRRGFYAALFATWLLLGWLVAGAGGRGGTAGFNSGVAWWAYALKQCEAIVRYLRLAFWPRGLVFDYGTDVATFSPAVLACLVFLLLLAIGTLVALRRHSAIGFLGAWFFCVLAPSSSVVPVATETMAEHRMYLALVAIVILVALLIYRALGTRSIALLLGTAIALGVTTFQRNRVYHDELALWQDTIAKRTGNERPYNNVGLIFLRQKQPDEAITWFQRALQIKPDYALALNNLGNALLQKGDVNGAIACYEKAIAAQPDYAEAFYNLGNLLFQNGDATRAVDCYETALKLQPDYLRVRNNLGSALLQLGRVDEAIAQFKKFLAVEPDYAVTRYNLGNALLQKGRPADAIPEYERFLQSQPNYAAARYNLGSALLQTAHWEQAIAQFQKYLELQPDDIGARSHLAYALLQKGRADEAIAQYEMVLRAKPNDPDAQHGLASAYLLKKNFAEALKHAEAANELSGDNDPAVLQTLAAVYAEIGRTAEAIAAAERALALAKAAGNVSLANAIATRLASYRAGPTP